MTGPLQALVERYETLERRGEAIPYGYSVEKIGGELVIGEDGELFKLVPLYTLDGKKKRPMLLKVPRPVKRTSGVAANFLWDKSSYVLGVSAVENKRLARERAAFVDLHRDLLAGTDDPGLCALLAFLERWTPELFEEQGFDPALLDQNLVFALDGETGHLHERDAAKEIWVRRLADGDGAKAQCLATGFAGPIARLHPSIKGVVGAQTAGASIVSFNKESFTSYGHEQGANAPVSERAVFAYASVLNSFLAHGSINHTRIGETTVVFWAENRAAELIGAGLFDVDLEEEKEIEADLKRQVGDTLARLREGRPLREGDLPNVRSGCRFRILGLAPNAARLSIRFWLDTTLGALAENFRQHWRDLRIEPDFHEGKTPKLWALLYELAAQRKAENIPAHIAGEFTRAIMTGGRYPRALLTGVLTRLRADRDVNATRIALLRACLVRERRLVGDHVEEDELLSLDVENLDPAYRSGRLFALLEDAQRAALGKVNASIRDRYYGAASANPAAVMPLLLRSNAHHLAKLRKERPGTAAYFDRRMGEIIEGMDGAFRASLSIDEQGRFAIGYYHERRRNKRVDDADAPSAKHEDD